MASDQLCLSYPTVARREGVTGVASDHISGPVCCDRGAEWDTQRNVLISWRDECPSCWR